MSLPKKEKEHSKTESEEGHAGDEYTFPRVFILVQDPIEESKSGDKPEQQCAGDIRLHLQSWGKPVQYKNQDQGNHDARQE